MNDLLNVALSNAVAAAVLALLAAAIGSVCRRPALVHGLWLLVLLKLVTPPLARIPVAWPAAEPEIVAEMPHVESAAPPETSAPLEEPTVALVLPADEDAEPMLPTEVAPTFPSPAANDPSPWPQALLLVWIVGSLAWFALALMRLERFRRLLRFARCAPPSLQERTRRLSRRLGLAHCPQVGLLPGRLAPMLWAVGGSPRLLLPADLLGVLGDAELDTLLVHELAHLRRRDHWVRTVEFAVMGLYWWHPVVWYARRELREAEEQCCDAWVVSTLPGAGRTYASALMDTLDFLSTAQPVVPPLASGLGQVSDLKRRLTMIMRGTTPAPLSWPGCLIVLALGAFFLPLLPALQAQTPPSKGDKVEEVLQLRNLTVQVEVDQSKAELQKLEADLKRKMAEVAQAQALLKAAAARFHAQQAREVVEKNRQAERTAEKGRRAQEMIRIEILVPAGKEVDVKELLKKIESVLPDQKTGRRITVNPAARAVVDLVPHETRVRILERVDAAPKTDAPQANFYYRKVGEAAGPQDKRINDLEKKLEKVLQELHDLRKQMKPRPEPEAGAGSPSIPSSRTSASPTLRSSAASPPVRSNGPVDVPANTPRPTPQANPGD